jgi:hypothetical protein
MPDSNFTTFPLFSEDSGPPSKRCGRCNVVKPLVEFHASKIHRLGVNAYCKDCRREYTKEKLKNPKHREKVKEEKRVYFRSEKYGISRDDFGRMLASQNGVCAICGKSREERGHKRDFHVDHDHKTNRVRGILCHQCNLMLGNCNDDVDILRRAIQYIERSKD